MDSGLKKASMEWTMRIQHYIWGVLLLLPLFFGCRKIADVFGVDEKLEKAYDEIIARHAAANDLEPELLKAVIWKESRFRKEQIGLKGELGLMQLMRPAIDDWARLHKCEVPSDSMIMEPEMNIEIGAWYLSWCGRRFQDQCVGDNVLRLAIYNAGYGRVRDNWLPKDPKEPLKVENISFPSTRDYIMQITERAELYKERHDF
ncbi:MAG: transglycosylase SLT domain-containing protein [Victivallales bacterium]|nr:transglycosylase SLT domain-containing protein [Victivallales bacterium]